MDTLHEIPNTWYADFEEIFILCGMSIVRLTLLPVLMRLLNYYYCLVFFTVDGTFSLYAGFSYSMPD